MKEITKISDIPYCGSLMIEGNYAKDFKTIQTWYGTNNPSCEFDDPTYFIAVWGTDYYGNHKYISKYYGD